ncbi:hypothetical protein MBLNU459_g1060t1 [Dothideomycetes sp. NU459]
MVKSNKFDYTGRTSSGPKLGKSIGADLEKRADKKKSTSTRNLFKMHSKPRATEREHNGDEERDNNDAPVGKHDVHKLDIKVPGKKLTDDGFELLADGLQNALSTCGELALVDLNVSDNVLTTRSLARLAPIIHQSRFSLQTLDLSNNVLQVTTAHEAHDWETFLASFSTCMTLRRLDLSHNADLGSWAFEILARVYSRERPVDPIPAAGNCSVITFPNDQLPDEEDADRYYAKYARTSRQFNRETDDLPHCANGKTLADTWVLGYRCGLRSLPYLTLHDVGLSDSGALFLSYVIEKHHYPIQLITELNASGAVNMMRTYQQDSNNNGIDWDSNLKSLSKDGFHLLLSAEKLRQRVLKGDSDRIANSLYGTPRAPENTDMAHRKGSTSNRRRSSARSTFFNDSSIYDDSELGSARKKVQRSTLVQEGGVSSVELWQAALKAIACSRKLFLVAPRSGRFAASSVPITDARNTETLDRDLSVSVDSLASYDNIKRSEESLPQIGTLAPIDEHQSRMSYAATLKKASSMNHEGSGYAITDVTNVSPPSNFQLNIKALSLREGKSMDTESQNQAVGPAMKDHGPPVILDGIAEHEDKERSYLEYQSQRLSDLRLDHGGVSDGYRDVSLQCQLPLTTCLLVMSHVMDVHDLSIMSKFQQRSGFAWGQKRETLHEEMEWRKKDESSQILMLLVGANCVEY